MAKITIDTDALTTGVNDIMKQITGLQGVNDALRTVINTIEGSWQGDSSTAYVGVVNGYAQQAEKMVNVLKEYMEYVEKANQTFTKLDADSAKKLRAAF